MSVVTPFLFLEGKGGWVFMWLTQLCRKRASRLAAEELFGLIKGRVDGMGGAKAWRESRKRQRELYGGGFGDEEQRLSAGWGRGGEEDGDGSGREEEGEEAEPEEESEETVS
jgi:hypothetical protein